VDTHVKVLAILSLVFAGLSALLGLGIFLLIGAVTTIVGTAADPADAQLAIPFIRLGGTAAALFCLLWAVPGVVVGIGLLKRRPWARVLGIVMSALSLMHVPFGTALGIYGLWVLFNRDTERLFTAPGA
jgi:ABC-type Fe3+ transport system permease subunit